MKAKIQSGQKYGRLTSLKRLPSGLWLFLCECGSKIERVSGAVTSGNTSSCGCLRRDVKREMKTTHGMSGTPEHNTWRGMIERCTNPKHEKYKNYGAKGISVHPSWLDFATFFKYVGSKPTPKHSLDRFPNREGNYEPGNVRWATQRQQCRNTEKNIQYTAFGKTMCMVEWAEEMKMSVQTLSWRLHECNMPIERALGPVRQLR